MNEIKFDQTKKLREVDSVEIISLVDNSIDFLSTIGKQEVQQVRDWVREREGEEWMREHFRLPLAEHGFSLLISVFTQGESSCVLFDTGGSLDGVVTNAERMGLKLNKVECVVLSHGHYDHYGGLLAALKAINRDNLSIITHEDMFKKRGVAYSDGTIRVYPEFPSEDEIRPAKYVKMKSPYFVGHDMLLVSGEIPRKTDFEKGFPQHRVYDNGKWRLDPWIWDDRAIIINVKNKGLVVVSGCAHAGIINTVLYAQKITGVTDIYAVMGGFHLAGKECEPRIGQTVEKMKLLGPKLLVPSHCTGWRGIQAIAEALPHAFVWNSVGNMYRL